MEDLQIVKTDEWPEKPYLPYLAAVEEGILSEDLTPKPLEEPLGVRLANGTIPTDSAGLIKLADQTYACDHAALIDSGKDKIFVGPSSKTDIGDDGEIRDSGILILSNPTNHLIKIIGIAVADRRRAWLSPGHNRRTLVKLFGLESDLYELHDVDNGIIEVRKRQR